jgi:hypothetical protein
MARADWAAYNYLCIQHEARKWLESILLETMPDDFPTAIQGKFVKSLFLIEKTEMFFVKSQTKYGQILSLGSLSQEVLNTN